MVTSVATGRSKSFSTPVGVFSYRKIGEEAFSSGMDMIENLSGASYLIAVPEKALVDKIQSDRGMPLQTEVDMDRYLIENLRMELSDIEQMDASRIEAYAGRYHSRKARLLARFVRRLGGKMRRGQHA